MLRFDVSDIIATVAEGSAAIPFADVTLTSIAALASGGFHNGSMGARAAIVKRICHNRGGELSRAFARSWVGLSHGRQ